MAADERNYDLLYFRLDLEPGAPVADIKQNYRQLAQIFHSDKWKYPSPASTKWAEERFKTIKEAKELLEDHWARHGSAPVSAMSLDPAAIQRRQSELDQLRLQKVALESETGLVRAEHARIAQALRDMDLERGKLSFELSGLRVQLEQARRDASEIHAQLEAEMAKPFMHARAEPGLAYQWVFTHFDDPEKGGLLRFGLAIMVFLIVWGVANAVTDTLFGMFYLEESWRWLSTLFDAVLTFTGTVVVLGWAWAQWTLYKANQAGQQQAIDLPVAQSWSGIAQALLYEGHYGSQWEFVPGVDALDNVCVEMRALLRFSTQAHPLTRRLREQVVTLYCRTGSVGPQQTSLTYRFELEGAPQWWLVPAARIVHTAVARLESRAKVQTQ